MTARLPGAAPAPVLDWSPFAEQIVTDAQAALGSPYIVLSRYDPHARTMQPVFIGGMQRRTNRHALRLGQRFAPRFDMFAVTSVDANPLLQSVFEGRHPVSGSVAAFSRGVMPPLLTHIAAWVAGVAYCLNIPLVVGPRVLGSLSCHQRRPDFRPDWTRTAQAFARQAALSIHNAELLEEGRQAAAALDASRRLVSDAEERTRRDISEFLHSRVQSRLLVAEYRLTEIRDVHPEAARQIEAIRADLEDLRERDVRQASHQLHPEALKIGLVTALLLLAERLQGALDVRLETDDAVLSAERTLPMAARLVVFHATEEALGNVLKHAGARQATVCLHLSPRALTLSVTDDGVGFDPAQRPPGLGLLSLGARVEGAGGRWGIESRPGGPTRVWAELPT